MKSLCITGSVQSNLDPFANTLQKAGAKAAAPALRTGKMSIAQWHEKVLATETRSRLEPIKPGRILDQVAMDIFLANHSHPLWFWAHENSVYALDYWLEFDASTHFVLMHTSPHSALTAALEKGNENNALLTLETVLQTWCLRTNAILNFYLRHPNRSVLIESSQAIRDSSNHIQALAKHWQLPLQTIENVSTPKASNHILELYLVTNLLQRHPYAMELHNEVQARLLVSPVSDKPDNPPTLDDALANLLTRRKSLTSAQSKIHELEQRVHASEQTVRQQEENSHHVVKRMQEAQVQLEQEKLVLQSQLNELMLEQKKHIEMAEHVRHGKLLENEQLLNQLHHTQEELEWCMTTDENRQMELEYLKNRLQKILPHAPEYWETENIELYDVDSENKDVVGWRLKNVYLDNCFIPKLEFKTRQKNGIAGLFIERTAQSKAATDWLRWPSEYQDATELPFIPCTGAAHFGNNAILSRLGTRDWGRLLLLVNYLIAYLDSLAIDNMPVGINGHALRSGLEGLQAVLAKWPLVFRFDNVELINKDQDLHYQALGIRLNNVSLGDNRWPMLEYRLATVDHNASSFGENPRLEFHEQCRNILQNWFAESSDLRGPRLELRFAKSGAFDTNVWAMLSDTDRLLISGLVGSLPFQLASLEQSNLTSSLHWEEWKRVGVSLRKILAEYSTRPQPRNRDMIATA
ncbi:hypothetical protein [Pseudomonas juntendi]|uniref:hypothetical protein n=1 Tax=Pseudomonas juntendi TaxID=2666183 RepID=UPI0015F9D205|nr:hypothetical protein [Pseudomonas juntendi]MBA6125308.1 hypothetical protein [Pseudomonas juntendi]